MLIQTQIPAVRIDFINRKANITAFAIQFLLPVSVFLYLTNFMAKQEIELGFRDSSTPQHPLCHPQSFEIRDSSIPRYPVRHKHFKIRLELKSLRPDKNLPSTNQPMLH